MTHSLLVGMSGAGSTGLSRFIAGPSSTIASRIIRSSALKLELFFRVGHCRFKVLSSIRAAFSWNVLEKGNSFICFFTGQNTRATSLAFFGEILIYLEYDLISIAVISGYEDYVI